MCQFVLIGNQGFNQYTQPYNFFQQWIEPMYSFLNNTMGNHENNPGVKYLLPDYDLFFDALERVAHKPHMLFALLEQKITTM